MLLVIVFVIAALGFVHGENVQANGGFAADGRTDSVNEDMVGKRADGLMHELVNLLVNEKLGREHMKIEVGEMKKQNKKVLNLFAEWKNKMDKKDIEWKNKMDKKDIEWKNKMKKIEKINTEWKNKLDSVKTTLERKINTKIDDGLQMIRNNVSRHGAVYIRWGRTTCPSQHTKLIYSGYAAGAYHQQHAGTNTQCLPKDPNWRKYQDKHNSHSARIYGAEYEIFDYSIGEMFDQTKYTEYDVPCAVCQSLKRSHVLMIPAKDRCYSGWHLEYRGYLMTQLYNQGASDYSCMEATPETIGSKTNHNGRLFYPVEARCGSLPCGPYVDGRELTCAVCTF